MISSFRLSASTRGSLSRALLTTSSVPKKPLVVTICGYGNASHVMMGQTGSVDGVETRVYAMRRCDELRKSMEANEYKVTVHNLYDGSQTVGTVDRLTDDPAEAMQGADLAIIALPVFAHKSYLKAIEPHLEDGTNIGVLPGQGGTQWLARNIIHEEKYRKISFFLTDKLPYNCRTKEFGKSAILFGIKPEVGIVYEHGSGTVETFTQAFQGILRGHALCSMLDITLRPLNQCLHPCRMWDLFHEWDGTSTYKRVPLFYTEMTKRATDLMLRMDNEIQAISNMLREEHDINVNVPRVHAMLSNTFPAGYIGDNSSLLSYFHTNIAYDGMNTPMKKAYNGFVPDYESRYFTEDVPYGLCVTKGVAELLNVPTPTIDMLVEWGQKQMGKEYLVSGKLTGKHVGETFAPQAFGFNKLNHLL